MKFKYLAAMTLALSVSSIAVAADSGEDLLTKNKCSACHKLDKKTVGPSVQDIAGKYAGNHDAQAMLEKKVRDGGGGVWGKMPMPKTKDSVSDDDIKAMVSWILSYQ